MKKYFPILLAVFSVISIIFSMDKTIVAPWKFGTVVENGYTEDFGEAAGVIVDHSEKRALFLDSDKRIVKVLEHSIFDENNEFYLDCLVDKNQVYLINGKYKNSSTYALKQSVGKYRSDGSFLETIAQYENDFSKEDIELLVIDEIWEKDGSLFVCNAYQKTFCIDEYLANGEQRHEEYLLPKESSFASVCYVKEENSLYFLDTFWRLYRFTLEDGQMAYVKTLPQEGYVLRLEKSDGEIRAVHEISSEGKYFSFAPLFLLRNLSFWFGIFYLFACGIFLCVRYFLSLERERKTQLLKKMAVSLAVFIGVGSIIAFYSWALYKERSKGYEMVSQMELSSLTKIYEKELADFFSSYRKNGLIKEETTVRLGKILQDTSCISVDYGYPIELYLVAEDGDKIKFLLSSDCNFLIGSTMDNVINDPDGARGMRHFENKDIWGEYEFLVKPIFQDGECVGHIVSAYDSVLFAEWNIKDMCILFFQLLIGFVSVYYLYREALDWKEGIEKRREYRKQGIDYCGLSYARPISALATAARSTDFALRVLIAKDILVGKTDYLFALLSLPVMASAFGYLIGNLCYPVVCARMRTRKMLISSTVLAMICFLFGAWTVYHECFLGLIVSVFMLNFFLCFSSAYGDTCVLFSPNQEIRRYLNSSLSTGKISSASLITILSGCVAAFGENYLIYFVGLLPSTALLLLYFVKFESITFSKQEKTKKNYLEGLRFLKKPYILLLVVCILIPLALFDGYKHYVFPLLVDLNGYSKTFVSDIQIFVKVACFQVLILIRGMEAKWEEEKIIAFWFVTFGVLFSSFFISTSILLATMTLLIVCIGEKHVSQCFTILWQSYAKRKELPLLAAQTGISSMKIGLEFFGTSVTGVIFGLGYQIALMLIGVYMFASNIFLYLSRKKKM